MSFVEAVLDRTRKIEGLLEQKFGAEGRGLHTKIDSVVALLVYNEVDVKRIRFIASVRNKLVHESGYQYDGSADDFIQTCDAVIDYLDGLTPEAPSYSDEPPPRPESRRGLGAGIAIIALIAVILVCGAGVTVWLQSKFQNETPNQQTPVASKAVKISQQTLNLYVGDYKYKNYKIKVYRKDDKLFTESPDAKGELSPKSETEFECVNYSNGFNGQINFVKNKNGKVTNLVVVPKNGQSEEAKKIK